ncbi:hypothetical protein THRCLA_04544, partial [Thraustotheca clavata]
MDRSPRSLDEEADPFVSASSFASSEASPDIYHRDDLATYRHVAAANPFLASSDVSLNSPPDYFSYVSKTSDPSLFGLPTKPTSIEFVPINYDNDRNISPSGGLQDALESFTLHQSTNTLTPSGAEPRHEDPIYEEFPVPLSFPEPYLVVNPAFPTTEEPRRCFERLASILVELEFKYQVQPLWKITVSGLLCAEEVNFSIALLKQQEDAALVDVNFYLNEGDEANFLRLFDIIRNRCSDIDQDAIDNTLLPRPKDATWLDVDAIPEIFPGSGTMNIDDIQEYCSDFVELATNTEKKGSSRSWYAKLELAKAIKNCCIIKQNRTTILDSPELLDVFSQALGQMVIDTQSSLINYAVFILNLFDGHNIREIGNLVGVQRFQSAIQVATKPESIPRMKSIATKLG